VDLRLRAEYSFHKFTNAEKYDSGVLLFQELRFLISKNMKNYLRICQYHTEDIALYMYENDLDGIMLNSLFKGDGIFYYFLMKYDLWQHYSLQFKFSQKLWKSENGYSEELKNNLNLTNKIKIQIEVDF